MSSTAKISPRQVAKLPTTLLHWYDRHRRVLPWRALPHEQADPYRIWLSEIMLQQTTVATVKNYFDHFVTRWPAVEDLAAAELDDVLHAWQGLGYYARARNLHACARAVVVNHGGEFPNIEENLRQLPGIGTYTAAAIAAIAFDRRAAAVDGNVERVIARLFAVTELLPKAKSILRQIAETLVPDHRSGDFAQAFMDLGATICTPKAPKCILCPWQSVCRARDLGIQETLPKRSAKAAKPVRHGIAFWTIRSDGAVLLRRRPESGLLGGMMEIPSTEWQTEGHRSVDAQKSAPIRAKWVPMPGIVHHTFTHFYLKLTVWVGKASAAQKSEGLWVPIDRLSEYALPTVMKKIVTHANASHS